MKPPFYLLLAAAALGFAPAPLRAAVSAPQVTYVIPIEGMIERGLVYVVRRGLALAEREGAGAVVFEMNTPGGKLDSAEEIVNLLLNLPTPTYTLVNPRAMSAGAIIALATDQIYMTPNGLIGLSTNDETPKSLLVCTARSAVTICGTSVRTIAMSSPNEPVRSCRNWTSSGDAVVPPTPRLQSWP